MERTELLRQAEELAFSHEHKNGMNWDTHYFYFTPENAEKMRANCPLPIDGDILEVQTHHGDNRYR